jgi:mRNA interferase MazF
MPAYVPEKGDFITLSFDPQSGREQRGRRPALIISNSLFNKATGLAIVCPITNTNRNIPFHLAVPNTYSLTGFVMAEQV